MKKTYIVGTHPMSRTLAVQAVSAAPDGYWITISEPRKKREQEEKYHAMIGEIAKQATYAGKTWDADDTKRILVDEFAEEMRLAGKPLHLDTRLTASENGRRVIQLGIPTSKFYVAEASEFIEFLHAWGAERGVVFNDELEAA